MWMFLTAVATTAVDYFLLGAGSAITLYCGTKTPLGKKK